MAQERWVSDHGVEPVDGAVRPRRGAVTQRICDHHTGHLVGIDVGPGTKDPAGGRHRGRIHVGTEQVSPHDGPTVRSAYGQQAAGRGQQERPAATGWIQNLSLIHI